MQVKFTVFDKDGTKLRETSSWQKAESLLDENVAYGFGGWVENQKGTVVAGKKFIRTINIAPTWRSILPVLLAAYADGTATGRALALEELKRMAAIADGCQ